MNFLLIQEVRSKGTRIYLSAKMEEARQRREAEKARLNKKLQEVHALNIRLAIIAREKREAARRAAARRAREKASRKKAAVNPLQALWDANGAAIYEANQAFKTKYGKNMSAKVRRKAIKDATRNGHFNAGAYAGNLVKAATPPPPPKKEDPYAGIGDWVERQDKSNAKMLDGASELEKWSALQKQKNVPVDSATASYMSMGAVTKAGNPYKMASPAYGGPPDDKDCGLNPFCWIGKGLNWIGERLFGGGKTQPTTPTATPAFNPTESAIYTQVAGTMFAPTSQPTATPTPMPLSLRVAMLAHQNFQVNNPNYYRFGFDAWYAHDSNCSNFVSQILWDTGIRFPGSTWNGDTFKSNPTGTHDNAPWYSTPVQQELFSSYNGEFRIALNENVPLRDDPNYLQVLENYPQLFAPGNMVFTSNRIIQTHNGEVISNLATKFSHVVLVDINSTLGNPLVVEQDGPADYIVKNGAYQATWDADANDYFYERNLNPNREVRSLSDTPTIEIDDQSRTVISYPSEISIIPVEPISLEAYGINPDNLSSGSLRYETKDCYTIQPSLLYCPPTVSP